MVRFFGSPSSNHCCPGTSIWMRQHIPKLSRVCSVDAYDDYWLGLRLKSIEVPAAHLLVTDVDNVFSRYVPLYGFLDEGYDVFHAYEMRYPTYIFDEMGFVVCSGHQFLRSSPGTLRFMELMENRCKGDKCDDQVVYNEVFWRELNVEWDGDGPTHQGAL